ncbi:MAG: WbuC family cupin fold metalloprotein [Acidobacteriota bacterium]
MTVGLRGVVLLGCADLERLSAEARLSPRRRRNRNLHEMDDVVHRLFNAIEPGSYVRPHRHLNPPKTETMVVVSGRLGLLVFDDDGTVQSTTVLESGGETFGVEVPPGTWHAFVSLAPGTVVFEAKEGPYVPPGGSDSAPWAPEEGAPEGATRVAIWHKLFETTSP